MAFDRKYGLTTSVCTRTRGRNSAIVILTTPPRHRHLLKYVSLKAFRTRGNNDVYGAYRITRTGWYKKRAVWMRSSWKPAGRGYGGGAGEERSDTRIIPFQCVHDENCVPSVNRHFLSTYRFNYIILIKSDSANFCLQRTASSSRLHKR